VEQATQPDAKPSGFYENNPASYYKYFWWGRKRPGGKSDFCAIGNKGQYVYVSPEKNLIIVRNGIDYGLPSQRWVRLFYEFATRLGGGVQVYN
jgi:CubicO group peptidase (beta-lactamase class C family)